ncbi:cytochrome C biogenesis protein [Leifsonia xyli subsp. xyli]|uniref:Cytochrome C biosynthesis associated protein n=2 Tax=Leifsonia xyli subsp. xyli TaxID=59736 RepID=Q6AHD2_LEIXX|nr:cytochrome c biogenesis protein ResB [Leifsonia xyli]AAT88213.1 cytochrome C biosynthesis associated protein [Leifsonia xyli subsp. xyli str. CTCB07]ODA90906.1 cytochrome C biogenesis protein [Leifsonia xyli subsp. xyli]
MSRPSDHIDGAPPREYPDVVQPRLGLTGWLRWAWRQLTSMRTALFLLLLLAIAAVPGSLFPQRGADPNGVTRYFSENPQLAPVLDKLQLFDVYTSFWFSAIYLLLFASLIGCIVPRTGHHLDAMRAKPPRTPVRLSRMAGFQVRMLPAGLRTGGPDPIGSAREILRRSVYRVALFQDATSTSVSAERGYLRESGNLVFHIALVGVLVAVGIGGGFGYTGQKVVVEGQSFVNSLPSYNSFNPGRFFSDSSLQPFSIRVDKLDVAYETQNEHAKGIPLDYTATVTTTGPGEATGISRIKVNKPLAIGGTNVYLLGNGYAPTITVRDPEGKVVFTDSVPFLAQDPRLTSLGWVKVPDGLRQQVGMIGFFYPTVGESGTAGALTSTFPGLDDPVLSLNVYVGDLGVDSGVPQSVYSLNTDRLDQLTGPPTKTKALELRPGQKVELPNGLGTISLDGVKRYASLEVHHDPAQVWVLVFAVLILAGLLTSLFVPRRRIWVKAVENGDGSLMLEYAGLARGEDPNLLATISAVADEHAAILSRPSTK